MYFSKIFLVALPAVLAYPFVQDEDGVEGAKRRFMSTSSDDCTAQDRRIYNELVHVIIRADRIRKEFRKLPRELKSEYRQLKFDLTDACEYYQAAFDAAHTPERAELFESLEKSG